MKVVVTPRYKHRTDFISSIPTREKLDGTVLVDNRNTITAIDVDAERWVVKQFKRPTAFNRIVYTFFRKTKSERAYRNAERLLQMGYVTAAPIAYIELSRYGIFHTGYYISEWLSYDVLGRIDEHPQAEQLEILDALAAFTVNMHLRGIYFYDFNVGNIMFRKEDGEWKFALIDINRMKFYKHPLIREQTVQVLKCLNLDPSQTGYFLSQYARLRGWNWKILNGAVLLKQGVNLKVRIRRMFKKILNIR